MQDFGRLLNRYSSSEPEVSDAINTLLKKKIVEYDEENNTLTVNMDIKLKVKGRLVVDCDDHIIMSSGRELDPNRTDGVPFSIWFNSELDENDQPMVELNPVHDCEE
jgi:hypothetical protein|tara:strand:- start:374 stop:694 length:321 start_codon:yes stop_codon:yes gene_type:complete